MIVVPGLKESFFFVFLAEDIGEELIDSSQSLLQNLRRVGTDYRDILMQKPLSPNFSESLLLYLSLVKKKDLKRFFEQYKQLGKDTSGVGFKRPRSIIADKLAQKLKKVVRDLSEEEFALIGFLMISGVNFNVKDLF